MVKFRWEEMVALKPDTRYRIKLKARIRLEARTVDRLSFYGKCGAIHYLLR